MQIADWSPSTTYSLGVVVKYNDDVWISTQPSAGAQPDKSSQWKILFGNNDSVGAVQYLLGASPTVINATDYGLEADGTDQYSKLQTLINAATVRGAKVIYFPAQASPYYFEPPNDAQSGIDPGEGFTFCGDGPGKSILQYYEGLTGQTRRLFYRSAANPGYAVAHRSGLEFKDLEFRGTYSDADATYRGGGAMLHLDAYESVRFFNCKWNNVSTFATDLHFCNRVSWESCQWYNVGRDAARARDSFYTTVTNCVFQRIGDDAVAWHTVDYTGGYNPDDGSPRREGLYVNYNFFLDTSVAVSALGARTVDISHNHVLRGRQTGFYITRVSTEGTHPIYQIRVTDNTIMDRVDASAVAAIFISGEDQRGTAASSNVIPGYPAVTTGAFQFPWNFNNISVTDAADPIPPMADILVENNTIGRTLPTVANYINWGFGYGGNLNSNPYNPAITNAGLRWSAGISVKGGMRVRIVNNSVSHTSDAIFLVPPASLNPSSWSSVISGNTIFDCTNRSIMINGSTLRRTDLAILNNNINGDFYRQSANSNANGTYVSGNTAPTAIDLGGNQGGVVAGNIIQNVARVFSGTSFNDNKWNNNTLICDPVAIGTSASNRGIGNIPNPADDFKFIIVDCDPTAATFGQLKNVCLERSNVQPTTGTYLQNQIVKNGNVVLAAGKTTYGWVRLTTGTGHVNGTDWTPMVIPNT